MSRSRDTRALALGSAAGGLLAYAVFALTTRALGAEAAAPVSVLWSYWAFAGAAFTFPLQHWIARSVAAHGEGVVRRVRMRLWLVLTVTSLVLGAAAWLARQLLFDRGDLWFPAMVSLVTLGSAATGVVRGALSARGRFSAVAASLVVENAIRCAAVGLLLLLDDRDVVHYGLCLVAGHLVVAFWPSAWRFGLEGDASEAPNPLAFLAGAGVAQLIGQVVLTGGPVLLALAGGSQRQVTTLFAALALFRAPYMLALGMVAQLTTRVAQLVMVGELHTLHRLRRDLRLVSLVVGALAALGAAWLGPWLLRLVFGADVVLGAGLTAVVALGCTVAVSNLVLMVSALAQGRSAGVARAWLGGIAMAGVVFVALSSLNADESVVWSFLTAELAAFVLLSLVEERRSRVG